MRQLISDLQPGTDYAIQVRAVSADAVSDWSRIFNVTTMTDTTLPKAPANVTWDLNGDAFHGEWDAVTQNVNSEAIRIDHYQVELVSGATTRLVGVVPSGTSRVTFDLSFEQNRILFGSPKATISMRVRAVDNKGLVGTWSSAIDATNAPPAPVANLTATGVTDGVVLDWDAPADNDLAGYNVYVGSVTGKANGTKINDKPLSDTYFNYGTLTATKQYFNVTAVDKFGQESDAVEKSATPSSPFGGDGTPPDQPTGVTAVITTNDSTLATSATVSWTLSPAPTDLGGYLVQYRPVGGSTWSQVDVPTDSGVNTSTTIITGLTPYVDYEFKVTAYDRSLNYSTASAVATGTKAANSAPSTPALPTVSANTMQIQVVVPGTKAGGGAMESDVAYYEVYAGTASTFTADNSSMLGQITAGPAMVGTFDIPANAGEGTKQDWYVKIIAVDRGGLKSAVSAAAGPASVNLISTANIGDAQITNAKITSLSVDKLTAGTGLATDFTIKSTLTIGDADNNGVIQSYNYGATTGYKLDKSGLVVNDGTIYAKSLVLSAGENLMPVEYSDFEYPISFYTPTKLGRGGTDSAGTSVVTTEASRVNTQCLKVTKTNPLANGYMNVYLGQNSTEYIVKNIDSTQTYLFSGYVMAPVGPDKSLTGIRWLNNANATAPTAVWNTDGTLNNASTGGATYATVPGDGLWHRFSFYMGTSAATTMFQPGLRIWDQGVMYFDAMQLETVPGKVLPVDQQKPSAYRAPGISRMDGNIIRTGQIQSSASAIDASGGVQTSVPAWVIDTQGDATFGNVKVRGSLTVGMDGETFTSRIQSYNYQAGETGYAFFSDGTADLRGIGADKIDGESITVGTLKANALDDGDLDAAINLQGTLQANGEMGEQVQFGAGGFQVFGAHVTPITSRNLTSNIAGLVTSVPHGYLVGSKILVDGLGAPFDGVFKIRSVTSQSISYDLVGANIASANVTGAVVKGLDASGTREKPKYIDFPTNGESPNIISGVLQAETLSVSSGATFRGISGIEYGAIMTIASAVLAPKAAPTVGYNYKDLQLTGIPGTTYFGATKGHNGNIFVISYGTGPGFYYYYISEHSATTGAYVATRQTISVGQTFPGSMSWKGIHYDPTKNRYYLLYQNTSSQMGTWAQRIQTFDTAWTQVDELVVNNGTSSSPYAAIGWDYTNSRIMYAYIDSGQAKIMYFDHKTTTTQGPSAQNGATVTLSGSAFSDISFISRGSFDFGADRIVAKGRTYDPARSAGYQFAVWSNDGAGTFNGNNAWPPAYNNGVIGAWWDTATGRFNDVSTTGVRHEYQGGDSYWTTTATGARKIAYTWYDADSGGTGTHETNLSPAASITIPKRARINVTIAPVPYAGSNDSPNQARIYMNRPNNNTTYNLRETVVYPATSTSINPNGTDGVVPPSTNGFAPINTNPGIIQSTSGNSFWKGDDTAQFFQLVVNSTQDVTATAGNKPALRVGNPDGGHLRFDGNEIQCMATDSTTGTLILQQGGGNISFTGKWTQQIRTSTDIRTNVDGSTSGGLFDEAYATAGTTAANMNSNGRVVKTSSSARYKENIEPMSLELAKTVMEIEPVTYEWIDKEQFGYGRYPGVIAEQAHEVGAYPWVNYRNDLDEDGNVVPDGFRYSEVTVAHNMLIKELYAEIESLKEQVAALTPGLDQ